MNNILMEYYNKLLLEYSSIPEDKYFFWKKHGKWDILLRYPLSDEEQEFDSHIHYRLFDRRKNNKFSVPLTDEEFWNKTFQFIDYLIMNEQPKIIAKIGSVISYRFDFLLSKRYVYVMVLRNDVLKEKKIAIKTVTDKIIFDTKQDVVSKYDRTISLKI